MSSLVIELKQKIKDLSETVFSKYASLCDKESRFPVENFEAIKLHNIQAIMVPKMFGGFGLNFYEYQQCLAEMSKGCSATASAFNMHNIVVGSLAAINIDQFEPREMKRIKPFLERIYSMVTKEKKVFAAATTEIGVGARFSEVKTNYRRENNRYIINGKKSFVTMSSYADYYMVLAKKFTEDFERTEDVKDHSDLSYFLIPRESSGVSIVKNWDVLGMRATDSNEVIFDNVSVGHESVFMGREGFALNKVMREPHWVTGGYLGVYLGIMESAFDFTCKYIKQRTNNQTKSGLGYQPLVQARIGEMYSLLNNAKLSVYDAANKVVLGPGTSEANNAIFNAKYVIGESSLQLTSLAIRTCGGGSIFAHHNLERHFRDSRCGSLMPAVSDMCQLYLGRSFLEIPENFIW